MADGDAPQRLSGRELAIACWGVGGVLLLVGQATYRLSFLAIEPLVKNMLSSAQLALYVTWVVVNAYGEGYRGFQKSFSPRVVSRAMHLSRHPTPLHVALAPVFCMGLFHADRRTLLRSRILLVGLIIVISAVRMLPQPWRGIVDGGVVAGLAWGLAATLYLFVAALRGRSLPVDSLPEPAEVAVG